MKVTKDKGTTVVEISECELMKYELTFEKLDCGSTHTRNVIEELLSRYKQIKPDITIVKTDIEKNPAIVQKYANIDTTGTLVIENKDKYEVVSLSSLYGSYGDLANAESLITNGIISVTTGEKKTVLFSES